MNDRVPTRLDIEPAADPESLLVSRRTLLAYAVSAPVLTVAAGFGVNLATPSTALASLPLTPPDTVDQYDIGDSIVQTSLPTMPLVTLSVGTDGRVRLDLPRLESGRYRGLGREWPGRVTERIVSAAGVPLRQIDSPCIG